MNWDTLYAKVLTSLLQHPLFKTKYHEVTGPKPQLITLWVFNLTHLNLLEALTLYIHLKSILVPLHKRLSFMGF